MFAATTMSKLRGAYENTHRAAISTCTAPAMAGALGQRLRHCGRVVGRDDLARSSRQSTRHNKFSQLYFIFFGSACYHPSMLYRKKKIN
jgi:hypothetical protein